MGQEKKVYSFRLQESFVEVLKGYAQKENRSLSNFIETILKEHVKGRTGEEYTFDSEKTSCRGKL